MWILCLPNLIDYLTSPGPYILLCTGHKGARHFAKSFVFTVLFTHAPALEIHKLVYLDSVEEGNRPRAFQYCPGTLKKPSVT